MENVLLRILFLIAFSVVLAAHPAMAEEPASPSQRPACASDLPADASEESIRINCEIPIKYRQDVMMAEVMGDLIRRLDTAAWLTTDALQEIGALENLDGTGKGWLTLDSGNRVDVRYFIEKNGQTRAFASAALDTATVKAIEPRRLVPPEPMTEQEQRLMRAKLLVLSRDDYFLCTKHPPNTVVAEFEQDGVPEILVFVMSAWADNNAAPLGGYHMYRVTTDGNTIIDHFSQTKSCLMEDRLGDEKVSAIGVSHLTSATPTMFHVFMSKQYHKTIYVSTIQNGLFWKVDGDRIELMKKSDQKSLDPNASSEQPSANDSTP